VAPLSIPLTSTLGDTRQRLLLCRVSRPQHTAKKFYRFPDVPSLLSVMALTLDKVPLCRVLHSAKLPEYPFLFVFAIPSKQTKDILHNHHTCITESSHTSNARYSSQRSHVSSQSHKYHKIVHDTNKYSHK
jgi:hypothetical protein